MNLTDHRQIKTTCTVHSLYLPEKGYIGGYFPSVTPAYDPQNLSTKNYDSNRISANFASKNPATGQVVDVVTSNSNNLVAVEALQGGLMPYANNNIGAPFCTFAKGAIVPNEAHPLYTNLKGPDYTVVFKDPNKTITNFESTALSSIKPTSSSRIPFQLNTYNNSDLYISYNVWDLVGQEDSQANKYVGPNIDRTVSKSTIRSIFDKENGSWIEVSSIGTYASVKRLFPTSEDVIYQNPKLYFEQTTNNWQSVDVSADGKINPGCVFKLSASTTNKDSYIVIELSDSSTSRPLYTFINYKLTLFANKEPILQYTNPVTNSIIETSLEGFGIIGNYMEIYFHFVGGNLLVGNNNNPSKWSVVIPALANDQDTRRYEHSIGPSIYPTVSVFDLNVKFQYSGIAFDHIYKDSQDQNSYQLFISNEFKAPASKVNTIQVEQISNHVLSNIYYGNVTNNIDNYKFPVTIFGDARVQNSFNVSENGLVKDGNSSYKNILSLTSSGRIDGPVIIRFDNNDLNTPTDGFGANVTTNSKVNENTANFASSVSSNYTSNYNNSSKPPILEEIQFSDLSAYVTDWTVSVNSNNINMSHISKTASVNLINIDHNPLGQNIVDLLENNLLVIRLSAGYGEENHVYFEGFCKGIKVTKSGSESLFTLDCEDVGTFALKNIYFDDVYLLTGMSIFKSFDFLVASSGFADYYQRNTGNKRYNFYGNLKLDPNTTQRQDLIVCQITDNILDKMNTIVSLMINSYAQPTFRWDEVSQKLVFDSRNNYLDSDFKFIGTKEEQGIEYIEQKLSNKNIPDWHGLLNGSYVVNIENDKLSAGVKTFGLTLEGYKNIKSTQSEIDKRISLAARTRLNNSLVTNTLNSGYVGFRKYIVDSFDAKTVPTLQLMRNRYQQFKYISKTPIHNIEFSCYVTKPLRAHGTFLINIFVDDNTMQTDPYIYQQVSYTFNKENNYITASVVGYNEPPLIES